MFIFKNITFKGFWLSKWYSENQSIDLHQKIMSDLSFWIKSGSFKLDYVTHPLENWETAISKATTSDFTTEKQILLLSKEC